MTAAKGSLRSLDLTLFLPTTFLQRREDLYERLLDDGRRTIHQWLRSWIPFVGYVSLQVQAAKTRY